MPQTFKNIVFYFPDKLSDWLWEREMRAQHAHRNLWRVAPGGRPPMVTNEQVQAALRGYLESARLHGELPGQREIAK